MAAEPFLPVVFFKGFKNGEERTAFGYLVCHPDGKLWCFQNEVSAAGDPFESGAFLLEPQLLKEIPDKNSQRQVFLYQKILGDPPLER